MTQLGGEKTCIWGFPSPERFLRVLSTDSRQALQVSALNLGDVETAQYAGPTAGSKELLPVPDSLTSTHVFTHYSYFYVWPLLSRS